MKARTSSAVTGGGPLACGERPPAASSLKASRSPAAAMTSATSASAAASASSQLCRLFIMDLPHCNTPPRPGTSAAEPRA